MRREKGQEAGIEGGETEECGHVQGRLRDSYGLEGERTRGEGAEGVSGQ